MQKTHLNKTKNTTSISNNKIITIDVPSFIQAPHQYKYQLKTKAKNRGGGGGVNHKALKTASIFIIQLGEKILL